MLKYIQYCDNDIERESYVIPLKFKLPPTESMKGIETPHNNGYESVVYMECLLFDDRAYDFTETELEIYYIYDRSLGFSNDLIEHVYCSLIEPPPEEIDFFGKYRMYGVYDIAKNLDFYNDLYSKYRKQYGYEKLCMTDSCKLM